ncbi:MAG: isoprenylcysteine carboxylmethyltransferase family protein [Planctomycetota bacterium]|nr:MAG: isoprenylcysteine carboxylmethyltransferase family protein [Planctomycetota bacterium]
MTAIAYDRRQRLLAVGYGLLCHALFAVAVIAMVVGLYTGLDTGLGRLEGRAGLLADLALALQFPLLHSLFLSRRGRRALNALAPAGLGNSLATTTYVGFASLQLLLVFLLWSPSRLVLWEATGWVRHASQALYGLSWVLVAKTMRDAGLGVQLGTLGWTSVARCRAPRYGGFPQQGSFRYCRQPVYAAFALTLWTGPVVSADRLLLAGLWTGYCLAGPLLKERRYLERYGEAFRSYQERVPFMIPRLRAAVRAPRALAEATR